MRSLLILLSAIGLASAWNLTLSPHGERLMNRRTGDNFLVVCKVKDYEGAASDVKVEWYRNGNLVSRLGSVMTIHTPYSNQLLINRPKTTDGGVYTCRAEVDGSKQESEANISFVDPPKFVDPQDEQHPEEGTDAEIICKVEGSELLEVFWQYDGVTLDDSNPRGYEFKDDKQTLVIPHYTSKKDDGIYNCNAAQHSSFETLSINVTGYSRPVITVFEAPEAGRGFEAQSAQLKCGAVGKPKPTYAWYNEAGEQIENSDKFKVDEGLLIIESLSSEDAGEYKCTASNPVGDDHKTAALSVFLKPRVERMVDITKKADENVDIICRYSGEGDMTAKFVYGDQEFKVVEEEVEATTEKAAESESEEDNEEEATTANHEETTQAASNENSQEEENDEEHETTHDEEHAEATTPETSQEDEQEDEEHDEEEEENARWKRFVDDVSSERVSVRADGNSLILSIRGLSLEDAGAYQCLVENEAGVANRTTYLAITHPPVIKSSSNHLVRSFEGNTVIIFCEVDAVPEPTWTWTKDGDEVEADGTSVQIDTTGLSSRLILDNHQGKNFGHYECRADNGIGHVEKKIHVMQVLPPATPIGLDCKKLLYPNYGSCSVAEGSYDDAATEPTEFEFFVATLDDIDSDFHWDHARIVKVDYDVKGMSIPGLVPSTQYQVRARSINEAGQSEMTEPVNMETTEPWAPNEPETVQMTCEEMCTISWSEPNDHGSEITGYRISVQPMEDNEETGERTLAGNEFIVEVGADETSLQLSHIRPHSIYKVAVLAFNAIGHGTAKYIEVETDDSPTSLGDDLFTGKMILAVGAGLVFLLLIVDMVCFCVNRCGLIACFCLNCLGRSPADRKDKDLEAGRSESGRLLENQPGSAR